MIRQPWGDDKWLLTPQAEHARIAGLIAAAWLGSGRAQGNGLLTAITHHEDGWSETDAAPALNSGGDPRSEGETPLKALMPIWDRTTKSLVSEGHLFAAALVASYLGRELRHHVDFEQSAPRAVVEAGRFVGELKRLSARLRAEDFAQATAAHPEGSEASEMPTGNNRAITPEAFDEDLRLLAACDRLSMMICGEFRGRAQIGDVPAIHGTEKQLLVERTGKKLSLSLSPLPFRKGLRDHVAAVIVPRRVYGSPEELASEIAAAGSTTIEFHIGAA